jgi:hypothetical protein
MTDADAAVETFLADAETVFEEYDQGYVDADAALRRLRRHVEDLAESGE